VYIRKKTARPYRERRLVEWVEYGLLAVMMRPKGTADGRKIAADRRTTTTTIINVGSWAAGTE
jgi:hypothetical protein